MVGIKLSENTSSYQKVQLDQLNLQSFCPSGPNLNNTYSESDEKRGFPDSGVSNKQNFEKIIAKEMKCYYMLELRALDREISRTRWSLQPRVEKLTIQR